MICIEPAQKQHAGMAPADGMAPPIGACFSERGTHPQPACNPHVPLAAGLFGVASCTMPVAFRRKTRTA
jgi:hypothetical protein